jgi:hypothetical protein
MVSGVYLLGGLQTLLQKGDGSGNAWQHVLGSRGSLIIFGLIYLAVGFGLAASKIAAWDRLHCKMLMVIYMVSMFSFLIEIEVFRNGFTNWVDTLTLTLVTGGIYLRAKWLGRKKEYDGLPHNTDHPGTT